MVSQIQVKQERKGCKTRTTTADHAIAPGVIFGSTAHKNPFVLVDTCLFSFRDAGPYKVQRSA